MRPLSRTRCCHSRPVPRRKYAPSAIVSSHQALKRLVSPILNERTAKVIVALLDRRQTLLRIGNSRACCGVGPLRSFPRLYKYATTKMVKMALSAMIRQVIPTTPLDGLHSASGGNDSLAMAAFIRISNRDRLGA